MQMPFFDTKTGYCTSFATAMAILGRCRKIPTRYVEGFATDRTCDTENSEILLAGSSAHAWTEAYLEPIGWVPPEIHGAQRKTVESAIPGGRNASEI